MPETQRSQYNYFVDRNEGVVCYNARTGIFALLADDVAAMLRGKHAITAIRDLEELIAMGFVHHGDEVEQIRLRFNQQRDLSHLLHLTLLPTLACNLTCDYCFQNEYRNHRVMSPMIQGAVLQWIKARLTEGHTEVLCSWFGGEPLLCQEIVLEMSRSLRSIVDAANGKLRMSIITNGTMLNSTTAKALAKVDITDAQVTFDALRDDGCQKRAVLDLAGGPSKILKNVLSACEHIEVSVRINVSRDNMDDVPQIIETLQTYGFGDAITFARTHSFKSEKEFITDYKRRHKRLFGHRKSHNTDISGYECFLGRSEYARLERNIFLTRPEGLQEMMRMLQPKAHFCSATAGYMFVIDPNGYISRCWHSAGLSSEAMGNVNDEDSALEETSVVQLWQNYAPFKYSVCTICKVLPLCMGGCAHPRVFMNASNPPCESIKQNIQYCVEQVAMHIEIRLDQCEIVR